MAPWGVFPEESWAANNTGLAKFCLFPSRMDIRPISTCLASFKQKLWKRLSEEEWRAIVPREGLPRDMPPCSAHLLCSSTSQVSCCWPFWYALLLLLLSSHPYIPLKNIVANMEHFQWKSRSSIQASSQQCQGIRVVLQVLAALGRTLSNLIPWHHNSLGVQSRCKLALSSQMM